MNADGTITICALCLDDCDECLLCDTSDCGAHADYFGNETKFCKQCRDACGCGEPITKGAIACGWCALELRVADTIPAPALEVA